MKGLAYTSTSSDYVYIYCLNNLSLKVSVPSPCSSPRLPTCREFGSIRCWIRHASLCCLHRVLIWTYTIHQCK